MDLKECQKKEKCVFVHIPNGDANLFDTFKNAFKVKKKSGEELKKVGKHWRSGTFSEWKTRKIIPVMFKCKCFDWVARHYIVFIAISISVARSLNSIFSLIQFTRPTRVCQCSVFSLGNVFPFALFFFVPWHSVSVCAHSSYNIRTLA